MRPDPDNSSDSADDTQVTGEVYLPAADLHNHTIYCGHTEADATVANILDRSSSLGLDVIGFSEHVMNASDVRAIERIRADLRALPDQGALLAAEIDIDTADPSGKWVAHGVSCDYVILSAHGVPQFDVEVPPWDRDVGHRRNRALQWLQWYGNAISNGGFQILGHPLREPMVMNIVDLEDQVVMEAAIAAFGPAIDQGIAFELNNAYLAALSMSTQYDAYLAMALRLRKLGMKFSRGSDSHSATKVGAAEAIASFAHDVALTRDDWFDHRRLRQTWR